MRKLLITAFLLTLVSAVPGCVYQPALSQGNLLKKEDVEQLEMGMTRNQVRFLLGTPMIADPFHDQRWDYVYYLRIGREDPTFKRWITIIFADDKVSEIRKDQELKPDV